MSKEAINEYLKHLRLIQFTLLVFCLLVFVTIFSQERSLKEKSILSDLEKIYEFLEKYPDGRKWVLEKQATLPEFAPTKVTFRRTNPNPRIETDLDMFVLDNLQLNYGSIGSSWSVFAPEDEILNLESFRKFWEYCGNGSCFVFNNHVPAADFKEYLKLGELWQSPVGNREKLLDFTNYTHKESIALEVLDSRGIGPGGSTNLRAYTLEEGLKNMPMKLMYYDEGNLVGNVWVYLESEAKKESVVSVVVQGVPILPVPFRFGSVLSAEHFYPMAKWRPFERAFPYLSELDEYYFNIPIREIREEYGDELKQSEKQIEVLGITVPEKVLSQWGPLSIILMSLYYAIHLSQYNSLRRESGEETQFPWIGLYKGLLSRATHLLTIVGLPLFSVVYVAENWIWISLSVLVGIHILVLTFEKRYLDFLRWGKSSSAEMAEE